MSLQQIHERFILGGRKYFVQFSIERKWEWEGVGERNGKILIKYENIAFEFRTNWAFCSRIHASLHNNCFMYSMDHTSIRSQHKWNWLLFNAISRFNLFHTIQYTHHLYLPPLCAHLCFHVVILQHPHMISCDMRYGAFMYLHAESDRILYTLNKSTIHTIALNKSMDF